MIFFRGLQILGLKPRDKLVMYCDTKAEWMVTAMGCFKFNYTLVTIYTNLGAEGVIYGINQTQSHYVCTSQELLPKLIKVLDKVRIIQNQVQFYFNFHGFFSAYACSHNRGYRRTLERRH